MRPACFSATTHMAEIFNRLPMHLGPQSCSAKECPRRLRAGAGMFIERRARPTVQGMNEHFGPVQQAIHNPPCVSTRARV